MSNREFSPEEITKFRATARQYEEMDRADLAMFLAMSVHTMKLWYGLMSDPHNFTQEGWNAAYHANTATSKTLEAISDA